MKVVGRECGEEGKSISLDKVTENFGVGVRGIEEICIKVTCDDHVLVVGREVGQSNGSLVAQDRASLCL